MKAESVGAVVTFRDISQRRAADEERAALYQKLLGRETDLQDTVSAISAVVHSRPEYLSADTTSNWTVSRAASAKYSRS